MSRLPIAALIIAGCISRAACGGEPTIRLDVGQQHFDGLLLGQSRQDVYLLARDGQLRQFAAGDLTRAETTSTEFRGYSHGELRDQLRLEFGRQFDVSGTGHYLVVHPAGQRDLWAGRFEDIYRSFVQVAATRGFRTRESPFPLVAIVFQQRDDFVRYAASQGAQIGAGVRGFYSTKSNRIVMYDQAAGQADDRMWQQNAAAIIHEVAHQAAFNVGVHNRFASQPRWAVEGLGMMFEAPGVWNSRANPALGQRVNYSRLTDFKSAAPTRHSGWVAELISSDRTFQSDPRGAYAAAWVVSFYLAETQPQKYFQYLAQIGARPNFQSYRSPERLQDFVNTFGDSFPMLEAQLQRFLDQLPERPQ